MNNLALTKRSYISVINSLNLNLFTMKKLLALIAIISVFTFTANAQFSTTGTTTSTTDKVGIGTTSPVTNAKLDVQGNGVNIGNTSNLDASLHIGASYGGFDRLTQIHPTGVSKPALNLMGSTNSSGSYNWWAWGAMANSSTWAIQPTVTFSGSTGLFITTAGKVGIGTTSPTGNLTVGGRGNINPNPSHTNEADYTGLNLTFKEEDVFGGNFDLGVIKMVQPADAYVDYADMVFQTSLGTTTEKMRISGEGNVSIGTPDAKGYKLAVNGTAIATEMFVKLHGDWPDFVFKPTYKLPKLSEVKAYIDANQHLPDMPSEAEVAKSGIKLGEMNTLLVKKVEELTLYLIEQDKEKKQLAEKLESQQQQIDKLTSLLQPKKQ